MFKIIQGNKTYIASVLAIAIGVYLKDINLIFIGLVGIGLRAKLSRISPK